MNQHETKDATHVHTSNGVWTQIVTGSDACRQALKEQIGIDMDVIDVYEDDERIIMPLQILVRGDHEIAVRRTLMIALSESKLVTIHDKGGFAPFEAAQVRLRRHPGIEQNSRAMLRLILHTINQETNRVIVAIGNLLEKSMEEIAVISGALNTTGREVGVADIGGIMTELNEMEELISRCLESQLSLARAARYLDAEVSDENAPELQSHIRSLREDINDVKEHAAFEHDKVRYLQNAVMASLNIKQNQIVKVFTIITAVFLPPTLVATFYGMNFAVMPELSWKHGFTISIALTMISALLPLVYIKRKGWLR